MLQWTNWAGNVVATPQHLLEPDSEAALAAIIRDSAGPVKVLGSGHSFSQLNEVQRGSHLRLRGFDGVAAEPGTGLAARVGAGQTLSAMCGKLHDLGQALANMGDVDGQRVGGALATATHGTGTGFGTYSAMIREMVMMDGQGQRQVLSRTHDEPALRAMAVSLGTGGIVTEAVLETIAPYRLAKRRFMIRLDDLLEDFDAQMRAARNVEFYYITHSRRCIGMESALTTGDLIARGPDTDQDGLDQLRLLGRLTGWAPGLRRAILGLAMRGHLDERFTEDWHRAYPTDRDRNRFTESEYHLPIEAAPQALRALIDTVERNFPEVYFPMEIRTVAPDDLFLSPFYKRPSVSIAVHHEAGKPFDALLAAIEPVFARFDGRPHWGKCHSLTARELRPLYPHWDEAIEARRHFDPEGRFLTPYLRQLLGL